VTPESAAVVEERVGHPREKWEDLKASVQDKAISQFAAVEIDWLDLMWTLDAYRIAQAVPRGFKDQGAINRGKGNWFAELLALLLHNRTHHRIGSRQRVQGFSQYHQIDVAWPARGEDPLVCCETKVTGAPAYADKPARKAMSDFSNRRKELKFASTDLKLYRRQQITKIEHWDTWRRREPPQAYFLWAARLEPGKDRIEALIREARTLTETYLDGAGIFAWQPRDGHSGYEAVPFSVSERVTSLDDVLYRIASEINHLVDDQGRPPEPEKPATRAVDPTELPKDRRPPS
jgi:hypothetical protein